jgi:hypothetical protein
MLCIFKTVRIDPEISSGQGFLGKLGKESIAYFQE